MSPAMQVKKSKDVKKVCSIRLTDRVKRKLIKKHGTVQHAIDYMISVNFPHNENTASKDYK